jgi:hypothetical protein
MIATDGLSEAQARAIWHAVAEARADRFDTLAAHAELVTAGYTPLEADTLVEEMLERLGGHQATEADTDSTTWPRRVSTRRRGRTKRVGLSHG